MFIDVERFWAKVRRSGDCWVWTGQRKPLGYGRFRQCGKWYAAHRLSYCLYRHKELSFISNYVIRHTCNNPSCVNPQHLKRGSHRDNVKDRERFGKHQRGSSNNFGSILCDKDVLEIRRLLSSGITGQAIAEAYQIDRSTISKIKRRLAWSHI